jgi:hypothetical protein
MKTPITYEDLKQLQIKLHKAANGNGSAIHAFQVMFRRKPLSKSRIHAFQVMFRRKPLSKSRINGAIDMIEALIRYTDHVRDQE